MSDSLGVSSYVGEFVWDALSDLGEGYYRGVSFKVEPWDQWDVGISDSIVGLVVNNARPAVISLLSTDSVGSGDIRFGYSLRLSRGDSASIVGVFYSIDGGLSWDEASVSLIDSGFIWRSLDDLNDFEGDSILVKLVVSSYGGIGEGLSGYLVVDNLMPRFAGLSRVEVDSFRGVILRWDRAIDISDVRYLIYAREIDGVYDFSSPFAETGDTVINISGLRNFRSYNFLVRAIDRFGHVDTNLVEMGAYVVIYASVDTVKLLDRVGGKEVKFVYRLNASSDDSISLRFEYSFDDSIWFIGNSLRGRVSGIVANVGVYVDTLVWLSYADVGWRDTDSLRVRITPVGVGGVGRGNISRRFLLDNIAPVFGGITGAFGDSSSVLLRWYRGFDVSDTIWYDVYVYSDSLNLFNSVNRVASVVDSFYRVTGLENFRDYYFGVRARDWGDNVDSNLVVIVSRPVHYASGYIYGLDTISGFTMLRYVVNAVNNDSGYVRFEYTIDGGRSWVLIDSISFNGGVVDSLSWDSRMGLWGYESDSVRLRVVVKGRGGVERVWVSEKIVLDNRAPSFSGLIRAIGGERSVRLVWGKARDVSFPVKYYIYSSLSSNNFDYSSPIGVSEDTSFVVVNLTPGVRYYFVVRAVDRFGHVDSNLVVMSAMPYEGLLGSFGISMHYPSRNQINVGARDSVYVVFMDDVDAGSLNLNNFVLMGSQSGKHRGRLDYYSDRRMVVFKSEIDFKPGEVVSVVLTRGIRFANGDSIPGSYVWSFTVKVEDGSVFSGNSNGVSFYSSNGYV
ncbi:Ig-like domain-containing protein, partial [Candidatus Kryptobacter tengchongensis]|uniref:Ig-like domain-containing protein n=1 Tax=Kryptobacter tengchongensis TaxID=1643429 RepID=UPI00117E9ED6